MDGRSVRDRSAGCSGDRGFSRARTRAVRPLGGGAGRRFLDRGGLAQDLGLSCLRSRAAGTARCASRPALAGLDSVAAAGGGGLVACRKAPGPVCRCAPGHPDACCTGHAPGLALARAGGSAPDCGGGLVDEVEAARAARGGDGALVDGDLPGRGGCAADPGPGVSWHDGVHADAGCADAGGRFLHRSEGARRGSVGLRTLALPLWRRLAGRGVAVAVGGAWALGVGALRGLAGLRGLGLVAGAAFFGGLGAGDGGL